MELSFTADRSLATELDRRDPLARFRAEFAVPRRDDGSEGVYMAGHSLGLKPLRADARVGEELERWARLAVRGHFEGAPAWIDYNRRLAEPMAEIVGAMPGEVVVTGSLTTNLHLTMVGFYRPTPERQAILVEDHAFPSDLYAVKSQIAFHGLDPKRALVTVKPRPGEELIRDEDLLARIEQEGSALALVLLPGVQYYTGQAFDIGAITRAARGVGAIVGLDLAHAAGNVPLALHDWDVDFAVWCSYKYLNSGPGAPGAAFVHERHAERSLPRFAGWWGHDAATRFLMGPDFVPMRGAEGWQLSGPPIVSLAAVAASMELFGEAGGLAPLRSKSLALTGYFEWLLEARLGGIVKVITPADPERRGAMLSLQVVSGPVAPRRLFDLLGESGVVCDWREPNVIRAAPAPFYNSFTDVWNLVERLAQSVGVA